MSYPSRLVMDNAVIVSSTRMKSLVMTEDLSNHLPSYSAWTCNR